MEAPPTLKEMEWRMVEAEKLGEVGRLPELSPTWQLAQVAMEAGPSTLGEKELELAQKKNWPWEVKLLRKSSRRPVRWRSPKGTNWGWWLSARSADSRKYRSPHLQTTLFAFSPWNSPWSRALWYVLPGAHHIDSAGSFRSIFGWAPRRHQPTHHSCKMHHYYAQRYTTHSVYLWRTSSLLNNLLPKVCFSLSVGCRLCGILPVPGKGT